MNKINSLNERHVSIHQRLEKRGKFISPYRDDVAIEWLRELALIEGKLSDEYRGLAEELEK